MIGNIPLLAIKYYRESDIVTNVTTYIGYFSTFVFVVEHAAKVIAYGSAFFLDGWNNFGLIAISIAIISIIISALSSMKIFGSAATIMRSFRILRLFRLFRRAKALRLVFNAFTSTIPVLANVGGLLMIILYLYSVIGVILFG